MRQVLEPLIARVGMDGVHESAFDAEGLVEHLGQRREAVRRATRIRDYLVRVFQRVVVHAHHDQRVHVVFRRHAEQNLLRAGLDVQHALLLRAKDARTFQDEVDFLRAPLELGGVPFRRNLDGDVVDLQSRALHRDAALKTPVAAVIA